MPHRSELKQSASRRTGTCASDAYNIVLQVQVPLDPFGKPWLAFCSSMRVPACVLALHEAAGLVLCSRLSTLFYSMWSVAWCL